MSLSRGEGGVRLQKQGGKGQLPGHPPTSPLRSGAQEVGRVLLGLGRHFQDEHRLPQPGVASLHSLVMSRHRLRVPHTTPLPAVWAEPSPMQDTPGSGSLQVTDSGRR